MAGNYYTVARIAIYPIVLLITLWGSCSLTFAESAIVKPRRIKAELPLISWVQPEKWREFGPISFRLQRLPEQEFMLIFPEWLTARNMSEGSIRPTWTLEGDSAEAEWKTPDYTLNVIVRATRTKPTGVTLHWKYIFHTRSSTPVVELAAFHCFLLDRAPLFKDSRSKGHGFRMTEVSRSP